MPPDREPVSEDGIEALGEGMDEQRHDISEALTKDLDGESEDYDPEAYLNDRAGDLWQMDRPVPGDELRQLPERISQHFGRIRDLLEQETEDQDA